MKAPHFLCLSCLLFGLSSSQAQVSPAKQEAEIRSQPSEADYGKLEGGGKLFIQKLYQEGFPAEWYDTLVYYPRGDRRGVKLQHNLRAINIFLAAEIRRPATVRVFLKKYVGYFLSTNLSEGVTYTGGADIITRGDADEHLDTFLVEADRRSTVNRTRAKAKLQSYARSGDAEIVGNRWTLDVNVITNDGAVEHWLIKGRVAPLQIDSFLCEPKEPQGTFRTMIRWS